MLYLGGVGLSFFLGVLLLSKRNKTLGDKILIIWLFMITLHLLLFYFQMQQLYPQLLAVEMGLPLVHGPLLFLYTRALTNRPLTLIVSMLHFLPAAAVYLYLIPFFNLSTEDKIFIFDNKGVGYETFGLIRSYGIYSSGLLYVVLSSVVLRDHRRNIANEYSYTDKISLQWLQYLVYWICAIWLIVFFGNDTLVFLAVVFFVVFIGFFGIRQVGIFPIAKGHEDKLETEGTATEQRKYQKSGLSADASAAIHGELDRMMSVEKLFREGELSLTDLANRLAIPPNHLSQVINEREGKNFYDYINSKRIEEFLRLAGSPDTKKYTLLGLAQECGFNSKSSFNRHFRKVTGKSPSEFIESTLPD